MNNRKSWRDRLNEKETRLYDLLVASGDSPKQAWVTASQICHYDTFDPPEYVPAFDCEIGKGIYDSTVASLLMAQGKTDLEWLAKFEAVKRIGISNLEPGSPLHTWIVEQKAQVETQKGENPWVNAKP